MHDRYSLQLPNYRINGKSVRDSLLKRRGTGYVESIYREIKRAWREAWEDHPIRKNNSEYARFLCEDYEQSLPKDKEQYVMDQFKKEQKFWTEVNRVQDEHQCERSQAILLVSDYMKRGDLPDEELTNDPNPKNKVNIPQREDTIII